MTFRPTQVLSVASVTMSISLQGVFPTALDEGDNEMGGGEHTDERGVPTSHALELPAVVTSTRDSPAQEHDCTAMRSWIPSTEKETASTATLTEWMVEYVEILPSLAKTYVEDIVNAGVGSVEMLASRVEHEPDFLSTLDIAVVDAEEIVSNLNRMKEDTVIQMRLRKVDSYADELSLFGEDVSFESGSPCNTTNSAFISESDKIGVSPIRDTIGSEVDTSDDLYRKKTFTYKRVSTTVMNECQEVYQNFEMATQSRMDAAISGVLTSIAISLPGRTDRQRAYAKLRLPALIVDCMRHMSHSIKVLEKAMTVIALLCRHSEENKMSVSLENAKALGLAGAGSVIASTLKEYSMETRVYPPACDAIRSLCLLESNRTRLGDVGVCEALGRTMTMAKILAEPELCCWIFRALGHLASGNEDNCARLGAVGLCEAAISALQRHMTNMHLCVEVCWAVRQIACEHSNRQRIADAFGPECLVSVLKTYVNFEVFVVEASKALISCFEHEEDPVISRVANAGCIPYFLKSLKRAPDSENLARSVLHLFYYITCDAKLGSKFLGTDIYDILSTTFEQHASDEHVAKWGCHCVHNLLQITEGGFIMSVSDKMRKGGLCEMVVSCVQRQAISRIVSGVGSFAIGDLASDRNNHARLSTSGACEAVVGALKRHDADPVVVFQTCYAIHYLSATENNIGWMGANGGCEAVTGALFKHTSSSVIATQSALRALGSLGYRDEGNLLRLHAAGACLTVVIALKTYGHDALVAEFGCRAIFNLCGENTNVSDLGSRGGCDLVVLTMQDHETNSRVVTEACLAIYGLAVKMKANRVHNGNTRKLVTKGSIECVVGAMKRFPNNADIQRAGAMAICSLGRLDEYRGRLGAAGAVDVVLAGFTAHRDEEVVVAKLAAAVDILATNNEVNKASFASANIVDTLLACLSSHERSASVVGEIVKALITMATHEVSKQKIRSEHAVKLAVRAIRLHEKDHVVARWGCSIIYTCATDNETRSKLGEAKACEAVISILHKHVVQPHHGTGGHGHGHGHGHGDGRHGSSENEAAVASWGCRAIVGLSVLQRNSAKFHNMETCVAVVEALRYHSDNALVSEWACAALVTLAASEPNRPRLGAAGGCEGIIMTLGKMASKSEIVTKLACEAIYDLALDEGNRQLLGRVGACEAVTEALGIYLSNPSVTLLTCRAVAGVGLNPAGIHNVENATRFGEAGACEHLVCALKTNVFNTSLCEWACAAIAALADAHAANQATFASYVAPGGGVLRVAPLLVYTLKTHRSNAKVSAQAILAMQALCTTKHCPDAPGGIQLSPENEYTEAFGDILNKSSPDMTDEEVQLAASSAATFMENSVFVTMSLQKQFSLAGIVPVCLKTLKTHRDIDSVAEHCCWIIGRIVALEYAPMENPAEEFARQRSTSDPLEMLRIESEDVCGDDDSKGLPHPPVTPGGSLRLPENNDLYMCHQHWDLLQSTLSMNLMRPTLVRHVCSAISMFAMNGHLYHEPICDAVMTAFLKYTDPQFDLVIQSILICIGNLAESHPDNKARLAKQQACQLIDQIFNKYIDGENVFSGAYRAVQGLAKGDSHIKDIFLRYPNFSISMVRAMYNELESEAVSRYGCAAITELAHNNPDFQRKLSPVCNFLADVLIEHQKSPSVICEAFRAISALSHANMTNRNRLGAGDCCEWVPKVLGMYVTANFAKNYMDAMTASHRTSFSARNVFNAELSQLIHWGVRCIADLAANHPNNQAKLGANGACEILVTLIKNIRPVDSFLSLEEQKNAQEISCTMAKWVCWALGNIVQLGKGSSMSIEDEGHFSVTKGLGAQAMIGAQKNVKNTARLAAAGAVDALLVMMLIYAHVDGEVAQWASRAMNNMGKSRGLKAQMLDKGAVSTLQMLLQHFPEDVEDPHVPAPAAPPPLGADADAAAVAPERSRSRSTSPNRSGSPKQRGKRMSIILAPSGAPGAANEWIRMAIDTLNTPTAAGAMSDK